MADKLQGGSTAGGSVILTTANANLDDYALDAALTQEVIDRVAGDAALESDKLDKIDYTAADVLTKLLTVDGPGTGLNADLLDGEQATYFGTSAAVALNTAKRSYPSADETRLAGMEDNATRDQTDAEIFAAVLAEDGPGTGLHADLLDGQEGSYYGSAGDITTLAGRVTANETELVNTAHTDEAESITEQWQFTTTDSVKIPSGNTAQRGAALVASIRLNTESSSMEFYDGANWRPIGSGDDSTTVRGVAVLDPGGNTAITYGDDLNPTITEGVAPTPTNPGDDLKGYAYFVGNQTDTLSTITGSSETFESNDLVLWTGTGWYRIARNKATEVLSFNSRSGVVLPVAGDYTASDVGAVPATDYTAADVLAKLITVDGAGTGVDADLLDGEQGTYYLDAANLTGAIADARLPATISSDITGNAATATNADTLDNVNSTSFLRSDAADVMTSGGLTFNDNIYIYLGTGKDVEHFCNGSHYYIDLNSAIGNLYIRDGSTTRFTFDDAGHFTATGNVTAYSDIKLKENIEVIPNAIDKILTLSGYTFDRIDEPELDRQTGVIAQEVQKVLPEAVSVWKDPDSGEETLTVAYGNMIGLLIEGMKEQQLEIDDLKSMLKDK